MSEQIKTTPVTITAPPNPDPEVLAITFCVAAIETIRDVETRARIAWYINERFGARTVTVDQS